VSIEGRIARLEAQVKSLVAINRGLIDRGERQQLEIECLNHEVMHLQRELHRRYPATSGVCVTPR
jgi:hypothetical protein